MATDDDDDDDENDDGDGDGDGDDDDVLATWIDVSRDTEWLLSVPTLQQAPNPCPVHSFVYHHQWNLFRLPSPTEPSLQPSFRFLHTTRILEFESHPCVSNLFINEFSP